MEDGNILMEVRVHDIIILVQKMRGLTVKAMETENTLTLSGVHSAFGFFIARNIGGSLAGKYLRIL